jgi:hypothetical protein
MTIRHAAPLPIPSRSTPPIHVTSGHWPPTPATGRHRRSSGAVVTTAPHHPPDRTIRRRLHLWAAAGLGEQIHELALDAYELLA